MSGFKRKPMPDELTEALRGHTANLPSVMPSPPQELAGRGGEGASPRPRPPRPFRSTGMLRSNLRAPSPSKLPRSVARGGSSPGS